jgi:hypothetical protein
MNRMGSVGCKCKASLEKHREKNSWSGTCKVRNVRSKRGCHTRPLLDTFFGFVIAVRHVCRCSCVSGWTSNDKFRSRATLPSLQMSKFLNNHQIHQSEDLRLSPTPRDGLEAPRSLSWYLVRLGPKIVANEYVYVSCHCYSTRCILGAF